MNNAMGKLQGRGIVCIRNKRINSKASINYSRESIPEKRVLYKLCIRGKHCQDSDFQDRCRPHKKKKLDFHTRGTELRIRTIIIATVQEVEVHGWLLSGSEELTILCCYF